MTICRTLAETEAAAQAEVATLPPAQPGAGRPGRRDPRALSRAADGSL